MASSVLKRLFKRRARLPGAFACKSAMLTATHRHLAGDFCPLWYDFVMGESYRGITTSHIVALLVSYRGITLDF
jgi:hypothetical protein